MSGSESDLILAHSFGGGGPDVEGSILAAIIVGFGIVSFVRRTMKPATSVSVVVVGIALAVGSFTLGNPGNQSAGAAPSGVAIAVTFPENGDLVPAGQLIPIDFELENARLTSQTTSTDPREGHIHVFVDSALVSMPMNSSDVEVTLDPGEHVVTLEFTTADHRSFAPKILDEITVVAE